MFTFYLVRPRGIIEDSLMQMLLDRRKFARIAVALLAGCAWSRRASAGRVDAETAAINARIKRQAVTSTSVAEVGYHADLQVLEIAFRSGAVYRYLAVPRKVFEGLINAESKGHYFTQHIRSRYEFRRTKEARP